MKKYSIVFAALLFCFILTSCTTQTSAKAVVSASETKLIPLAKTLLWKIEGNGLEKASYLYGTIHMISQSDYFMTDHVKKAFGNTERAIFELDMDDPTMQAKMMQHAMMKDGMTIDQLITKEEYAKLDAMFKETVGMGVDMFKGLIPTLTSAMFLPKLIDGQPASYEQVFVEMANKDKKDIIGLETVEDQLGALDKIPYNEQADYMMEMLSDMEKAKADFAQLVAIYKQQDVDGLYTELIRQSAVASESIAVELVEVRNKNWISKIENFSKEKSNFFAVGAGHLGGEMGVIRLLRNAGYSVTPVLK